MRSQPLNGGSPRRLLWQAGKWVLEVVRHVNLGEGLIRPTTQRLSGKRVITSYFSSNPDKASLGRAAQKLMQAETGNEFRSYTVSGGEWIVNSTPPARGDALDSYPPPEAAPSLDTQIGELRAQVVLLSLVQEGLLTRLARVEAKLARGSWVNEQAVGFEPEAFSARGSAGEQVDRDESVAPGRRALGDERGEVADEEDDVEEEAADPGGGGRPSQLAAEPNAAPEPSSAAVEPAPAPVPERTELELPPTMDLARCIALLVGGDASAEEAPPLAVNRTTKDCYASPIMDDTDRVVGLILMDLKATVYLGGTLMMLPKSELEAQLRSYSPGEDSIAASAEICNALSGAINGAQDQHVRAGGLEKFEFRSWGWVTEPAHRRDLQDNFGGRTVVFSRPAPTQIF